MPQTVGLGKGSVMHMQRGNLSYFAQGIKKT